MYCKFCGNRISSNSTKCASCGAKIDLNDGGQSFFDDHELEAWQSDDIMMSGPRTSMPKTEMRETSRKADSGLKKNDAPMSQRPIPASMSLSRDASSYSRKRSGKSNSAPGRLKLSNANRFIIFCIASVLAIVLFVVAIIAILNQNGTQGEGGTDPAQTTDTGNTETEQSSVTGESQGNETGLSGMDTIDDITILVRGDKVEHNVSAYSDKQDNTLYVSLDKVLDYMGYKNIRQNEENKNCIIYEDKENGNKIEIEKKTNKIWVNEQDNNVEPQYLDHDNFNVGTDTYVPARSFFEVIGYSVEYNSQEHILTVEAKTMGVKK